jgi:hypothetical protein
MRQSTRSSRRRAVSNTYYVDDSGEETARYTLMGGPVFPEEAVFAFHYEWDRVVSNHSVSLPIHMKEFARPNGRLAYLTNENRRALLSNLVALINTHKIYSLSAVVDNLEFQEYFPPDKFRWYMGSASLAFTWCMLLNHVIVEDHDRMAPMGYLVSRSDVGSQITDAYRFWKSYEGYLEQNHTGSLAFDEPRTVNALQAADLVAWANNRKHKGLPFDQGFEPLELLARYVESEREPSLHFHFPVDQKSTRRLAAIVGQPKSQKGKRTSLWGVISPSLRKQIDDGERQTTS